MSENLTSVAPPSGNLTSVAPPSGHGTWSLSRAGVRTVMALELRQRVRSTRWIVILGLWVLVLAALTALIRYAVFGAVVAPAEVLPAEDAARQSAAAGRTTFGLVIFLVLALGGLVAPALSATSINGDRRAGVLATLQVSLLSPAEIAIGRLLAAWFIALALLVTGLPFILWAYLSGGTPFGRLLVTVALTAITLLVVCAIGLGWSAITARTSSSVVLTYLTVMGLGLGLPIIFALSLPLTEHDDRVRTISLSEPEQSGAAPTCVISEEVIPQYHSEYVWWIVAPSPFVVVADASPKPRDDDRFVEDPLSLIRLGVREARLGSDDVVDHCGQEVQSEERERARAEARERAGVTWPFGLAADLLLAAGSVLVTVRRLRAPAGKLSRGVRIG